MTPRLECSDLTGGRGSTTAFRGIDLAVEAGTVLALLGPNGAGKTTLLLTLAGLLPAHGGAVCVDGVPVPNGRAAAANGAGVVLVPDDRSLFPTLTVEENLRVASRRNGPAPTAMIDIFPALATRWNLRAGALSGGEQQMLAMARALIQEPKVLLVDELSMGLAPLVVEDLFATVRRIATDHGCAVLLVEQHVELALEMAEDVAVVNRGSVILRGQASEFTGHLDRLEQAYFSAADL
ncbi:MAG TPA: ATP-binding cassette domain-containing protein [Acidimicrobiales bacterium]|nr:ATP-binding cassette domain-containing protein [Acidimicrobiales bacterium]